ncbi:hypothetical protein GCM10010455_18650 [Microbacterium esteraromaticum]
MLIPMGNDLGIGSAGDFGLGNALYAEKWNEAAVIIERHFVTLVTFTDQLPLLVSALELLPEPVRDAHPALKPAYEFVGVRSLHGQLVSLDLERIRAGGEAARLEMHRLAVAFIARRLRGAAADACAIVDDAESAVLEAVHQIGSPAESFASLYFLHAGISHHVAGDLSGAKDLYLLAWQWRQPNAPGTERLVGRHLALLAALSGETVAAEHWLAMTDPQLEHKTAARFRVVSDGVRILAQFIIALDRLDLEAAGRLVARLPSTTRYFEFGHYSEWAYSRWLMLTGHPRQANHHIDALSRLPIPAESYISHLLRNARADAMLAEGDVDGAIALLPTSGDSAWTHLLRARAAAIRSEFRMAIGELDAIPSVHSRYVDDDALVLRAASWYRLGEHEKAREASANLVRKFDGRLYPLATVPRSVVTALIDLVDGEPGRGRIRDAWGERDLPEIYPFRLIAALTLTDRERVIINHLKAGASRREIATVEIVSLNTVKSQISTLYRKLGARSGDEAIANAQGLGLI